MHAGCGFLHNPAARRRRRILLRTGEEFTVTAVNWYHAGSQVVYGATDTIRVDSGRVVEPGVRLYRENIALVEPLTCAGDQ